MANLDFQDFTVGGHNSPFTSINQNNDQRDPRDTKDSSGLISDGTDTTSKSSTPHFLSFKFYQQYFDVDTDQVQARILNSVLPKPGGNFIRDHVQPVPDLYGPFWICVTLVFFAGICGNFAHYIDSMGDNHSSNDFKLVTGVATLIFLYVTFLPLGVYLTLWYRNAPIQYTYVELLSAFGYSLAVFIPVSVLWIVHFEWFRWALIAVSVALSGTVLANTIWSAIKTDNNKLVSFGLVAGVLLLHALLAVAIKEFYFDTVIPKVKIDDNIVPAVPTPAALIVNSSQSIPQLKTDSLVAPTHAETLLPTKAKASTKEAVNVVAPSVKPAVEIKKPTTDQKNNSVKPSEKTNQITEKPSEKPAEQSKPSLATGTV